jgi:hypothetical protein
LLADFGGQRPISIRVFGQMVEVVKSPCLALCKESLPAMVVSPVVEILGSETQIVNLCPMPMILVNDVTLNQLYALPPSLPDGDPFDSLERTDPQWS